jgi:hypothetical protein
MKQIQLTQGKVALVDDKDFDYLNQWKWQAQWSVCIKGFYATTNIRRPDGTRTKQSMHRLLLGNPPGLDIDHIDHDTLNNTSANLRVVTRRMNASNLKKKASCSSQYVGVTWSKHASKWIAQIKINKVKKYLGCFDVELDAYNAYLAAKIKYGVN